MYGGAEEYQRWLDFRWSDFDQRNKLRKTYYARHARYSDGHDHACFGGLVQVPEAWERQRNEKVLSTKKKKKKKKSVTPEEPRVSPTKRMFDTELGKFVIVMDD